MCLILACAASSNYACVRDLTYRSARAIRRGRAARRSGGGTRRSDAPARQRVIRGKDGLHLHAGGTVAAGSDLHSRTAPAARRGRSARRSGGGTRREQVSKGPL